MSEQKDVIRIANSGGWLCDRRSGPKEMVMGGPIDVLTGDYLAELTMSVLHSMKAVGLNDGSANVFMEQLEEILVPCLDKGIKIVNNAGGLNPKGMAEAIEALAAGLGRSVKVAYIDGDDLVPRLADLRESGEAFTNMETGEGLFDSRRDVITANAYLGAWGIKEALDRGADIVIAPRVTDASMVVGPAAWKFGWKRDDYDALAGALAAGHIIECSSQATGGNYAFFQEVPDMMNIGFPIAEIEADGSFTVTKHPGTGGLVSTGTVTAQVLYEIGPPAYLNPDVVAHFDSIDIEDQGNDRVRVSGIKGSSPPDTHKVCVNTYGGFKSTASITLTGLDIEEKARLYSKALLDQMGGREAFDEVYEQLIRSDKEDPQTNEEAFATLRITFKSQDHNKTGQQLADTIFELLMSNGPGLTAGVGMADIPVSYPFNIHWPSLIDSRHIVERMHFDGETVEIQPTSQLGLADVCFQSSPSRVDALPESRMVKLPLGRVYGTRAGDKGGHANLGVWARSDEAFQYLYHFLTVDRLKLLFKDLAPFEIERYELANIRSLNFLIKGMLGQGISAAVRMDGQAKSLGEYVRARIIDVPNQIVDLEYLTS